VEQRQAAKTRVENLLKDYTTSTRYQEVTLAMKGPSVVLNQSQLLKILSTFGDKCPQNGSKNVPISPKTNPGITLAWNEVTCCSGGAGGGAGARERGADAGPGSPESSQGFGDFHLKQGPESGPAHKTYMSYKTCMSYMCRYRSTVVPLSCSSSVKQLSLSLSLALSRSLSLSIALALSLSRSLSRSFFLALWLSLSRSRSLSLSFSLTLAEAFCLHAEPPRA